MATRKHSSLTLKEQDAETWRMVKAMSPEHFIQWQKDMAAVFVELYDKASKTSEELMERRDKMLAGQRSPVVLAELKKKFHEKILEKRGSPSKAIKGGRRQKRITPALKGGFHL